MKEENFDEREFAGLERRLRSADLGADSRVKDALKARLLARARRPARFVPLFAWLMPAFAAAALFVTFGPRPEPPRAEPAASASPYALPDDGYGPCGRRGLGDFMASERF
ncbi:MAG TPA: hypothetical protein DCW72_05950 [Elusimicrobia bacterium]|nr:MAG: hypothetical protein A2X29_10500 [Elusimicrobia bacterium GWA2_64_40]OGR67902.1 MAG: hypothetical protein A2X30_02905 [Elusimicrobia bacterium GWB2_63_16]HAN04448.1 hypothetical protein [Elusimicrobiota bacterium]HAU89771.1 hypothetical protein [Elusimicrobiota bacterium]